MTKTRESKMMATKRKKIALGIAGGAVTGTGLAYGAYKLGPKVAKRVKSLMEKRRGKKHQAIAKKAKPDLPPRSPGKTVLQPQKERPLPSFDIIGDMLRRNPAREITGNPQDRRWFIRPQQTLRKILAGSYN